MKILWNLSLAFAVAAAAAPLHAQSDGIVLIQEETERGQTTTNRILLDANRVRAESNSSSGQTAFVYDGAAEVIRMIEIDRRTYTEISRQDLERMQQQMNAAMAQLQAQLQSLPPAQRQMMEQMMRGQGMPGMPAQAERLEYRAAGQASVGQWTCTRYEAFSGSVKTMELCAVPAENLGLTAADFQVALQLMEFIKSMVPQLVNEAVIYGSVEEQGFEGVPVRKTTYENGNVASVSELKEIRREVLAASEFQVPQGFTRQTMPGF